MISKHNAVPRFAQLTDSAHSFVGFRDSFCSFQAEGEKLSEKRQSLTADSIAQKLDAAAEKREQLLDEKKAIAKQLENHPSSAQKGK